MSKTANWMARLALLVCLSCAAVTRTQAQDKAREAVKPPAHLYAADPVFHRILQMDDLSGKNLRAFGTEGTGTGQFAAPLRLWVDKQNRLYVCDTDNHRLVRMDDITGKGWTTLGTRGKGEREFQFPVSVWIEDSGRITVLDVGNRRIVQMDDFEGKNWRALYVSDLSAVMAGGNKHSRLWMTPNVVVDRQGRLYYPLPWKGAVARVDDISGKNPVTLQNLSTLKQGGFPNFTPEQLGIDAAQRLYILSTPGFVVRVDDITSTKVELLITSGFINGISVSDRGDVYITTSPGQIGWKQEAAPGGAFYRGATPWHDIYDKLPAAGFNAVSFFVR